MKRDSSPRPPKKDLPAELYARLVVTEDALYRLKSEVARLRQQLLTRTEHEAELQSQVDILNAEKELRAERSLRVSTQSRPFHISLPSILNPSLSLDSHQIKSHKLHNELERRMEASRSEADVLRGLLRELGREWIVPGSLLPLVRPVVCEALEWHSSEEHHSRREPLKESGQPMSPCLSSPRRSTMSRRKRRRLSDTWPNLILAGAQYKHETCTCSRSNDDWLLWEAEDIDLSTKSKMLERRQKTLDRLNARTIESYIHWLQKEAGRQAVQTTRDIAARAELLSEKVSVLKELNRDLQQRVDGLMLMHAGPHAPSFTSAAAVQRVDLNDRHGRVENVTSGAGGMGVEEDGQSEAIQQHTARADEMASYLTTLEKEMTKQHSIMRQLMSWFGGLLSSAPSPQRPQLPLTSDHQPPPASLPPSSTLVPSRAPSPAPVPPPTPAPPDSSPRSSPDHNRHPSDSPPEDTITALEPDTLPANPNPNPNPPPHPPPALQRVPSQSVHLHLHLDEVDQESDDSDVWQLRELLSQTEAQRDSLRLEKSELESELAKMRAMEELLNGRIHELESEGSDAGRQWKNDYERRERDLAEREAALFEREGDIFARETQMIEREALVGQGERALNAEQKLFEAKRKASEEELKALQKAAEDKVAACNAAVQEAETRLTKLKADNEAADKQRLKLEKAVTQAAEQLKKRASNNSKECQTDNPQPRPKKRREAHSRRLSGMNRIATEPDLHSPAANDMASTDDDDAQSTQSWGPPARSRRRNAEDGTLASSESDGDGDLIGKGGAAVGGKQFKRFAVPGSWAEFLKGLPDEGANRKLPVVKLVRTVNSLLVEKLIADDVADREGQPRQPLPEFVVDTLIRNYGLWSLAAKNLRELVNAVNSCTDRPRIVLFARFCGLIEPLPLTALGFYLSVLTTALRLRISTLTQQTRQMRLKQGSQAVEDTPLGVQEVARTVTSVFANVLLPPALDALATRACRDLLARASPAAQSPKAGAGDASVLNDTVPLDMFLDWAMVEWLGLGCNA